MKPNHPRPIPPVLLALSVALLAAWVPWAGAQEEGLSPQDVSPWSPAQSAPARLSAMDALRIALEHNPNVALAHQNSLASKGSAQEASGSFDGGLLLDTYFQYAESQLLKSQVTAVANQRLTFRILSTQFDQVADNLLHQLDTGDGFVYADCGATGINTTIGSTPVCINGREAANRLLIIQLANNFGYDQLAQGMIDVSRREAANLAQILQYVAYQLRIALRQLGTTPKVEETNTAYLQLGYAQAFRNGVVLTPAFGFEADKDNYLNKPANAGYGGKGVPDQYNIGLGLSVDVPLGKGRGRVSADAPERAAKLSHDATVQSESHVMSQVAFQTLVTYWQLVAAQETLAILERSAERQEQLLKLGDELVKIDEVAAVDLDQLRARLAQTHGFVSEARQSVVQARLGLAKVLGLEVNRLEDAPFAADDFPAVADPATLATWQASSLATSAEANRRDLSAARTLEESAKILADAARADLKRTFDLSFQVGYSGMYEGGSWTRPVDLVDGLHRALFGRMVPSAMVMLTVEWPLANDVALGQLEQAQALAQRSAIQARDLERGIDNNTQQEVGALRKATDEVARRQAAVDFYRQALDNEIERYKLGQSTTIDVILTEEKQTSALLSLAAAKQTYAALLAQLRYELGVLLGGRIEDGRVFIEQVEPISLNLTGQRG